MAKYGPKPAPLAERFWSRVDKSGECWLWTGTINHYRGGYGQFAISRSKNRRAHRVAYELTHGVKLPPDVALMHTCDVPACVRPSHLREGTAAENVADMHRKGREGGFGRARITDAEVVEIRRRHAEGETGASLGRAFGVSKSHISRIVRQLSRV